MVIETLHRLKRASFASLLLLLLHVAYPIDARILFSSLMSQGLQYGRRKSPFVELGRA